MVRAPVEVSGGISPPSAFVNISSMTHGTDTAAVITVDVASAIIPSHAPPAEEQPAWSAGAEPGQDFVGGSLAGAHRSLHQPVHQRCRLGTGPVDPAHRLP